MYKRITLDELKGKVHPVIIDVREPDEFAFGNIPSSINIPIEDLLDKFDYYLTNDKEYYIYCKTELRSGRICEFLADLGYDVYLIEGGYQEWLTRNKYQ